MTGHRAVCGGRLAWLYQARQITDGRIGQFDSGFILAIGLANFGDPISIQQLGFYACDGHTPNLSKSRFTNVPTPWRNSARQLIGNS